VVEVAVPSWIECNMEIKDKQLLYKIIDLQSSIIEGKDIKDLLHTNIDFFLEKSGAAIISIYMHEHEKVKLEYILERDRHFADLFKKYILDKDNLKWEKFVDNLNKYFLESIQFKITTDLYKLFKGFLNKKDARSFTSELNMKSSVLMPLYSVDRKRSLGYVCFLFQEDNKLDLEKLKMVQRSFQMLLRPLYNTESNTIYNKCVRVDENMDILTAQERRIVKIVLKGSSYEQTAESLNISINTMKTHMKNIFCKYNVYSKVELYNKIHVHY